MAYPRSFRLLTRLFALCRFNQLNGVMEGISISELEESISYSLELVPPPTCGLMVWP